MAHGPTGLNTKIENSNKIKKHIFMEDLITKNKSGGSKKRARDEKQENELSIEGKAPEKKIGKKECENKKECFSIEEMDKLNFYMDACEFSRSNGEKPGVCFVCKNVPENEKTLSCSICNRDHHEKSCCFAGKCGKTTCPSHFCLQCLENGKTEFLEKPFAQCCYCTKCLCEVHFDEIGKDLFDLKNFCLRCKDLCLALNERMKSM
jgi:hypothetical protein